MKILCLELASGTGVALVNMEHVASILPWDNSPHAHGTQMGAKILFADGGVSIHTLHTVEEISKMPVSLRPAGSEEYYRSLLDGLKNRRKAENAEG